MAADALNRISMLPVVAAHARDVGTQETLTARYFDTADRQLSKRGITFRVRKEGGGYVQTVKTAPPKDGAALTRCEWSAPVDGWDPDRDLVAPAAAHESLLRKIVLGNRLEPIFETDIRRDKHLIDLPAGPLGDGAPTGERAVIEMAIDRGTVAAGGRKAPIAEIELELIEGRPDSLYRFAMAIAADLPVRPSVINKAAMGWRLAEVPADSSELTSPTWVAAPDPKWTKRKPISTDDALAAVVSQCLFHLVANTEPAREGVAEGIHQMRVATRRLRSIEALFRSVLPQEDRDRLREGARMIAAALGPARDWDVLQIETLPAGRLGAGNGTTLQEEPAWDALKVAVEQRRAAAHRSVAAMIDDGAFGRFTIWLGWWYESRGWRNGCPAPNRLDRSVTALASKRLAAQHRKVTTDAALFATLDTEARHAVRKRVKKLRYSVDFFSGLYKTKSVKGYRKALKSIQDRLGRMNDAAVADALLTNLCRDLAAKADIEFGLVAGRTIGWIDRDAAEALAATDKIWNRFRNAEPFWR